MMRVKSGEWRVKIWCVRFADTFLYSANAFPLWGKVARYAPDEGEISGSCPLISHLR